MNQCGAVLSLITSCKNRDYQLVEVFHHNVNVIEKYRGIEWVIIDYGSNEPLESKIPAILDTKSLDRILSFYTVVSPTTWHMSRAKNLGHRLAKAPYVFNLDADNFITEQDIDSILEAARNGYVAHQFSGTYGDGSHGRIGASNSAWDSVGGYDETFLPMGFQDVDFLIKLHKCGNSIVRLSPPKKKAVQNSASEKMNSCSVSEGVHYGHFNKVNQQLSKVKLDMMGPKRDADHAGFVLLDRHKNTLFLDSNNTLHAVR